MNIATRLCCLVFLTCAPLLAQIPTDSPVDALRSPSWNKGLFIGGSQSFANTPSAQSLVLGGRIGRVLTHELGHNPLRGSFEMAVDIIPLNEFWIQRRPVRRWHRSLHRQMELHRRLQGSRPTSPPSAACYSATKNLPPGDTSKREFHQRSRAWAAVVSSPAPNSIDFSAKVYHLSNASLGNKNPGINGAVQFMLGYTWH